MKAREGSRAAAIITGCLAMAQHGVVLLLLGAVLPDLMSEFGVRESLAGLLLGVGSFGFTVGPLVSGRLIDRRGVKAALLVGFGIEVVVLGAFGVVPAFAAAVALNFSMRFGASFVETSVNVLPATLKVADARRGASLMNLMHTFFGVGALATPVAVGLVIQLSRSWRAAFWGAGLLTAALLAVTAVLRLQRSGEAGSAPLRLRGLDPFVAAGAFALFLYVGAEAGTTGWAVYYLRTRFALPPVEAGAGLTLYWVGIMAGRSINSLLARRIGTRALILGAAATGLAAGIGLMAAGSPGGALALLLLFGVAISGTYPNVMISVNARYPGRVGQVTAVLTIAAAAGSMVFNPVLGILAQVLGPVSVVAVPAALMGTMGLCYARATRPAAGRPG